MPLQTEFALCAPQQTPELPRIGLLDWSHLKPSNLETLTPYNPKSLKPVLMVVHPCIHGDLVVVLSSQGETSADWPAMPLVRDGQLPTAPDHLWKIQSRGSPGVIFKEIASRHSFVCILWLHRTNSHAVCRRTCQSSHACLHHSAPVFARTFCFYRASRSNFLASSSRRFIFIRHLNRGGLFRVYG